MGKPWFNAKRFGFGVGLPCSWEGWAVVAVFLAVMFGGPQIIHDRGQFGIVAVIALIALIVIAAAKTKGGWRWRWGRD